MCSSLNSTLRTVGTSRQLSDSEQHSRSEFPTSALPTIHSELLFGSHNAVVSGKGCWRQPSVALSGRLRCGLILVSSAMIPGSFGVMNNPGRRPRSPLRLLSGPVRLSRLENRCYLGQPKQEFGGTRERSSLQDALSRL